MDQQQYAAWRLVALTALRSIYTDEQCDVIIGFFDRIKGDEEDDLTGLKFQEALRVVRAEIIHAIGFSLYHDLMARVWLYAPMILKAEMPSDPVPHYEQLAMADRIKFLSRKFSAEAVALERDCDATARDFDVTARV